mgnify:CR=1 FL=1
MRIHAKWALVALLGITADGFSWETGRGDNKPGPAELNFGVLRPMDSAAARAGCRGGVDQPPTASPLA